MSFCQLFCTEELAKDFVRDFRDKSWHLTRTKNFVCQKTVCFRDLDVYNSSWGVGTKGGPP
jgi:hypothetical protein